MINLGSSPQENPRIRFLSEIVTRVSTLEVSQPLPFLETPTLPPATTFLKNGVSAFLGGQPYGGLRDGAPLGQFLNHGLHYGPHGATPAVWQNP
jgi:hypothetical protein